MTWILILVAIVLVYLVFAMRGRARNRRLTSEIADQSLRQPRAKIEPRTMLLAGGTPT